MTSDPEKPLVVPQPTRTNPFRKKRKLVPLAIEEARRQGAISALAFLLLGGRDAAVEFLNTENLALGGRPIAIATRSSAGYATVERDIRSRSALPDAQHGG